MTDYSQYTMNSQEKIKYLVLLLVVVWTVSRVFFDTSLIAVITPAVFWYTKSMYENSLADKRRNKLLLQFKDLLYALSSSMATGRHLGDALKETRLELIDIYDEKELIIVEIDEMLNLMNNTNAKDTDVLDSLAERSGLEDIKQFAQIYKACKTTGGNLIAAINKCASIIGDKIAIEADIKSMGAQKRLEGNIIVIMPIGITFFLKTVSPDYLEVLYCTDAGRIIMLMSLACTIGAYFWMGRISKIEV